MSDLLTSTIERALTPNGAKFESECTGAHIALITASNDEREESDLL